MPSATPPFSNGGVAGWPLAQDLALSLEELLETEGRRGDGDLQCPDGAGPADEEDDDPDEDPLAAFDAQDAELGAEDAAGEDDEAFQWDDPGVEDAPTAT